MWNILEGWGNERDAASRGASGRGQERGRGKKNQRGGGNASGHIDQEDDILDNINEEHVENLNGDIQTRSRANASSSRNV